MMRSLLPGLLALGVASAASAAPDTETEHTVEPGETLNGIAHRAGVARDRIIEANDLTPPYLLRAGETLIIPRSERSSASSSGGPATYVVKAGETLGGIANREKVPRVLIAEANGLKPPYLLQVGQSLMIPRTRRHTVRQGETGFGIALQHGVPWKDIAIANGLEETDALPVGRNLLIPTLIVPQTPTGKADPPPEQAGRFAWPLQGPIRREFKPRGQGSHHDGLDIVAPEGAAVRAVANGTVIFAGKEAKQFGNLVVIDHGDGWHSAYGSLGRVTVRNGHKVTRGERVGLVGSTSITRRTELHFELRRNGEPVDPLAELPESP